MLTSKINKRWCSRFVPRHRMPNRDEKKYFKEFLIHYSNILVLTGAGVSTESGIPDYRSEGVGMFNRTNYKPITYSEFLNNENSRTRYWARNYIGWPNFSTRVPNKTHLSLTHYQFSGNTIGSIITQNVDGLHHKGGNINVVELHGNAYWVQCLKCKRIVNRHDFQKILHDLNPTIPYDYSYPVRPDGDVEISEDIYSTFKVPGCEKCGGILKPTVVFFGDSVPPSRVKKVENLVRNCEALLVMGTTLSTLSSCRIVDQAFESDKFICIVNIGATKYDYKADLVIHCNCSQIFPQRKEEEDE